MMSNKQKIDRNGCQWHNVVLNQIGLQTVAERTTSTIEGSLLQCIQKTKGKSKSDQCSKSHLRIWIIDQCNKTQKEMKKLNQISSALLDLIKMLLRKKELLHDLPFCDLYSLYTVSRTEGESAVSDRVI